MNKDAYFPASNLCFGGGQKNPKVAAPPIPFHQNHPETHLWSSLTFVFGHQIGT